jgi:hypothetical protein
MFCICVPVEEYQFVICNFWLHGFLRRSFYSRGLSETDAAGAADRRLELGERARDGSRPSVDDSEQMQATFAINSSVICKRHEHVLQNSSPPIGLNDPLGAFCCCAVDKYMPCPSSTTIGTGWATCLKSGYFVCQNSLLTNSRSKLLSPTPKPNHLEHGNRYVAPVSSHRTTASSRSHLGVGSCVSVGCLSPILNVDNTPRFLC